MNADYDDLPVSELAGSEAIERLIEAVCVDEGTHPLAIFFLYEALEAQREHEEKMKGGH